MDEREKIIREDYPVERLPEDLRGGFDGAERVRVTIEPAPARSLAAFSTWSDMRAAISELHKMPGFRAVTSEEAVARVRELRDEWD